MSRIASAGMSRGMIIPGGITTPPTSSVLSPRLTLLAAHSGVANNASVVTMAIVGGRGPHRAHGHQAVLEVAGHHPDIHRVRDREADHHAERHDQPEDWFGGLHGAHVPAHHQEGAMPAIIMFIDSHSGTNERCSARR